jgi:hypothetical protein
MDLQNQPGTVEKRDIKRVETLDNVDYEVKGNIATSVGEDAAENDILNEEDNYEKSFLDLDVCKLIESWSFGCFCFLSSSFWSTFLSFGTSPDCASLFTIFGLTF